MRRHAPFEPIDPNICMWGGVHDVINPANFFENRPKGFGASRPRNLAFPIDFAGRPYNTLTLPCEVWWPTGSRIRAFDWCQNRRPWMTLKGHYALCFKAHASFGAHHENLNEDRLTSKYMIFKFSLLQIVVSAIRLHTYCGAYL